MAAIPREHFCIDHVTSVLDKYPFSAPGAALITAYSYWKARQIPGPPIKFRVWLRRTKWLKLFVAFVTVKTLNRALTRLALNHGWSADKPRWSHVRGRGDIVLITGGSTGIGKDVVELLSKKTSNIISLDMAEPTYRAQNVRHMKCDVTDSGAIAECAKQIRVEYGHPTIIFNNAGILRGKLLLDTTPEEFLMTYKVNVLGCANILREFLPAIARANHGHIVTTASSASYMSIPSLGEYSVSKSAALSLHEVLSAELVHRYNAKRVRTSVICPTKVYTSLGSALQEQERQWLAPTLTPAWVAQRMVDIVDSGLSQHLIAPNVMALMLPNVRSLPEWFRYLVNTLGKTHDLVNDKRNDSHRRDYAAIKDVYKKHGITAD